MKLLKKNTMLCIILMFGVVLSSSSAFAAATGFSDDAGGPMGLAIQGNAPGEKLAGVMCLELYNPHVIGGDDVADGYAVVRLRKSNLMHTFYAEIFDVSVTDPIYAQDAIMAALDTEIKNIFFDGDDTVVLVLRNAEEWGSVDGDRGIGTDAQGIAYDYTVVDVVVAGK